MNQTAWGGVVDFRAGVGIRMAFAVCTFGIYHQRGSVGYFAHTSELSRAVDIGTKAIEMCFRAMISVM